MVYFDNMGIFLVLEEGKRGTKEGIEGAILAGIPEISLTGEIDGYFIGKGKPERRLFNEFWFNQIFRIKSDRVTVVYIFYFDPERDFDF